MWTLLVGNDAHLDSAPSSGAPLHARFTSSPLKRTPSKRPLRRRRVSALASQQRRETKWGPTRDSTRACHTHRAQRLLPSVHFVPGSAIRERDCGRSSARRVTSSRGHRSHHSRAFPGTWWHPHPQSRSSTPHQTALSAGPSCPKSTEQLPPSSQHPLSNPQSKAISYQR